MIKTRGLINATREAGSNGESIEGFHRRESRETYLFGLTKAGVLSRLDLFELQPTLRAEHFEYIRRLIQRGEVLNTVGLDNQSPQAKSYHVTYAMQGGPTERILVLMFYHLTDPATTLYWYTSPNGKDDWKWRLAEEYDELEDYELKALLRRDDLSARIAAAKAGPSNSSKESLFGDGG
jgi:hypothetical protein